MHDWSLICLLRKMNFFLFRKSAFVAQCKIYAKTVWNIWQIKKMEFSNIKYIVKRKDVIYHLTFGFISCIYAYLNTSMKANTLSSGSWIPLKSSSKCCTLFHVSPFSFRKHDVSRDANSRRCLSDTSRPCEGNRLVSLCDVRTWCRLIPSINHNRGCIILIL